MHWMLMPYRRYAEFSGRSRRMEYWMFYLFTIIVTIVCYALMLAGGGLDFVMAANPDLVDPADPTLTGSSLGALFWIGLVALCLWALATIIPSLAVTVRRLHDRNMSGWYLVGFVVAAVIVNLIPVIGPLLYLAMVIGWIVILAMPGTQGPNKYGSDPLGQADPEVFA